MNGYIEVSFVRGLGQIYLEVYDGGDNRIDDGTLNQGESTRLSIQKKEDGSYLLANNVRISLDNVIRNPGQSENQTVGGIELELVFISSEPGYFQEDAGGGSINRE
ncbi:2901_t:CDS:2 [Entrophospora sp. SA101]|nr:4872_t:CDS:2 [Entrophospora sp. SA101]CAJ0838873.1 2901_t:CDS:2 [Entrophospora sp. SA101]